MKILLTGALGTVGCMLSKELEERDHDVWLSDLSHHHSPKYIRCDISKYRQLERIFGAHKFDYVYNLAAEFGRWNGEDYYENLWLTNVVGLKHIIRLQEKLRFKLVHFSSSEVYGDWGGVMGEGVMDTEEIKQLNDYAMTKWVNEMQITNSANMFQTESVRIRLFNVYGPGEYYSPYRSAVCLFIYRALHDIPYKVYTSHHRSFLYVTDACNTLANIVENFKPGEVYNIASVAYYDMKAISDIILKLTGQSDKMVQYIDYEPFTTKDKKVDTSKAVSDLAHNPRVSLEEGLAQTVQWMKQVYKK